MSESPNDAVVFETSGEYPFRLLESLLPYVDLILFDVKAGGRGTAAATYYAEVEQRFASNGIAAHMI
jgi:pyruvate-formate lyase-activating enzyme